MTKHGMIGTSTTTSIGIYSGFYGKLYLHQMGDRPCVRKCMGRRKRQMNIMKHIQDGSAQQEIRYVLMQYGTPNIQIKDKVMTRYDAGRRNRVLKGTGFAWAQCSI